MKPHPLRLGVNIDHVATLRNVRGGAHPDPLDAALAAAGADGITAHLREDRRHIRDEDIARLRAHQPLPLNLEVALTEEMLAIALRIRPHAVCIVPERREEVTTEGGLNVAAAQASLIPFIAQLQSAGIRTSLFIAPEAAQIDAAARTGVDCVELHTGAYAHAWPNAAGEIAALQQSAKAAHALGLEVHAGHGLTYANVGVVAAIPEIRELNIGHFLIGEAIFRGLGDAIAEMRRRMDEARA